MWKARFIINFNERGRDSHVNVDCLYKPIKRKQREALRQRKIQERMWSHALQSQRRQRQVQVIAARLVYHLCVYGARVSRRSYTAMSHRDRDGTLPLRVASPSLGS